MNRREVEGGSSNSFVARRAVALDQAGGFTGPIDIVVRNGWIEQIGDNAKADDLEDLDFGGLWLLPGVFDCHDHVSFSSLDPMELMRMPVTQWVLETARNLRETLDCGVTFVRDAAGADAGMRTAVARGDIPGPDLSVSIVALTETGGHFDGFLPGPALEITADYVVPDYPGRPTYLVDGQDAMRSAVRQLLRAGADWIKLCTTGGVLSPFDDPLEAQFTLDEIRMAVSEAQRRGKGVMVHAFGGEGLDNSIAAGVRSIEHGIFLTDEQAIAMAEARCFFVPTLAILHDILKWASEGRLTPYGTEKAAVLKDAVGEAVRIAYEHGVRMAVGTDFVERDEHGSNLRELDLMRRAGMTPEDVLLAATSGGAELCGVSETLGRLEAGYRFDALVLEQDPGDLSLFASRDAVKTVFKAGRPVRWYERLVSE